MEIYNCLLFVIAVYWILTPCTPLRLCAFLRLDQQGVAHGKHVEAALATWVASGGPDVQLLVAVLHSPELMSPLATSRAYRAPRGRLPGNKRDGQQLRVLNRMIRNALQHSCNWLLSVAPDTYVNVLALLQRLNFYNQDSRWILAAPVNSSSNLDDMYLISQGLIADNLTSALQACATSGMHHFSLSQSEPNILANCWNSKERQTADLVKVLDVGLSWQEFIPDWHVVGRLLKVNHQRMQTVRPGRRLRMHRCLMAVQGIVHPRDFHWIHRRIQSHPRHVLPSINDFLESFDMYSLARLYAHSSVETCLFDPMEVLSNVHNLQRDEKQATMKLWLSQWHSTHIVRADKHLEKQCSWNFFEGPCKWLHKVPSEISYQDCISMCCQSMHCNVFSYHDEEGCWMGFVGCYGYTRPGWRSGVMYEEYLPGQALTPPDWIPHILFQFDSVHKDDPAYRAEAIESAALREKEAFSNAISRLVAAEQRHQVNEYGQEKVDCLFTVDNAVIDVFYNGRNLTQVVTGLLGDWTSIKKVTFEAVTGGVLAIGGYNYEATTGEETCGTAGLLLGCSSSDQNSGWQNLGSTIQNMKSFGTSSASAPMKWFHNDFNDSTWQNPCASTSFFSGIVGTRAAQRVWGGNKWSFFRIRPEILTTDELAASAVFHATRSSSFGLAAIREKMFATKDLVYAVSPWREAHRELSLSRAMKTAIEHRLFQPSMNFTLIHIAGSIHGWATFCTMTTMKVESAQCLRTGFSQLMVELKDHDTLFEQQLLLAHVQRTPFLRWFLGWESHTVIPKYYIPGNMHDNLEELQDPTSIYGDQVRNLIGVLENNWETFAAECLNHYAKMRPAPWPTLFSEIDDWRLTVLYSTTKGWNRALCEGFPSVCGTLQGIFPFRRDWDSEVSRISREFFSSEEEVGFFALAPGSKVRTHNGGSNARLNIHVGLAGVEGARLLLPHGEVKWQLGKAILFNDGMDHGVVHEGLETRFVIFVRLRHPHVTYLDYAKLRVQDILVHNTLKMAKHM